MSIVKINAITVPADSGEGSGGNGEERIGDFEGAFAQAPVTLDATYRTADESHAMLEPHATTAAWEGDRLTLWTANQMIGWGHGSIAKILGLPKEKVRLDAPYVGGGFGSKLGIGHEGVGAAIAAEMLGRPVAIAFL